MNFELMKNKRKELGMTQQELADKCGLSKTTIFNYESGKFEPTKENIKLLSEALNISEADLLTSDLEVEEYFKGTKALHTIVDMRKNLILLIRDKLIAMGKAHLNLIESKDEIKRRTNLIEKRAEDCLNFLEYLSGYGMIFSKKIDKILVFNRSFNFTKEISCLYFIDKSMFLLLIENIDSLIKNTLKISKNAEITTKKSKYEFMKILSSEESMKKIKVNFKFQEEIDEILEAINNGNYELADELLESDEEDIITEGDNNE